MFLKSESGFNSSFFFGMRKTLSPYDMFYKKVPVVVIESVAKYFPVSGIPCVCIILKALVE